MLLFLLCMISFVFDSTNLYRALPSFLVALISPRLYMHELRVKQVSLLVTAYANKPVFVGVDRTPLKFAAVELRHIFSSVGISSAHHLATVCLIC